MREEEERIFNLCKSYFVKHGFMPDAQTLCDMSGYKAKSTVIEILNRLESAGKIKILRRPNGVMCPRAYSIVGMKVRFKYGY